MASMLVTMKSKVERVLSFAVLLAAHPLAHRPNRLFGRRGHVGDFGHHVCGPWHVRLTSQPRAHGFTIGHGEPAFAPTRHENKQ